MNPLFSFLKYRVGLKIYLIIISPSENYRNYRRLENINTTSEYTVMHALGINVVMDINITKNEYISWICYISGKLNWVN